MALLRPFRPLRYNVEAVGDLSTVVAPPYDVISDARREALYARGPYNVVRLILNKDADPYAAAGQLLREWRRDRILIRDPRAALCYYIEDFTLSDGSAHRREGVIGVVRLEPFHTRRIRPHERTFASAKEDRMRLLRACRTNLSPIFGLLADESGAFDPARAAAQYRTPDIDLRDDTAGRHRVWLLAEPTVTAAICDAVAAAPVMIADGHHRYETALAYADEQRAHGNSDPDAAHNFILMYLTGMRSAGLVILPTHRVLSGISTLAAGDLESKLSRHFRLTRFARSAAQEFSAQLRQRRPDPSLGIALAGSDELLIATLVDSAVLDYYAAGLAPVVRNLDVTVLDTVILRGLLGIDCTSAAQEGKLRYTHDDDDALAAVARGAQAAFLMSPPRIEDVQAVCAVGETMPEKSTYFYPKLLTGLVFHPFDE